MLNSYQFSAAKCASESKMLQSLLYDENKTIKSYSKFKQDAKEISDISQETWFRVEYENCRRGSVQGEQFRGYMDDKDLYPYWVYKGMMDDREREEHVELEGAVFKIGDPEGDACFPSNGDNCRCDGENCDDDFLKDNNLKVSSPEEVSKHLEDNVNDRFKFNASVQGPLPNFGSYFDVMKDANEGTAKYFGLDDIESDDELEGFNSRWALAAKGLHAIIEEVNDWRKKYHVDEKYNIVFQNKVLYTNVRFNNNSLHAIQKHSKGFENIPGAISNSDEVWMSWQNADKQRVVARNYIKFGKTCYIVQTIDGYVSDAFAVSKLQANKYRKGVIN